MVDTTASIWAPQGEKGPTGDPGPAGPAGPIGPPGPTGGGLQPVNNVTALLALSKVATQYAVTMGYYTPGDGGGAIYYLDAADTTSVSNGGTIQVAADGGRWKIQYQKELNVKWFGARGNNVNDDWAKIQAAVNVAQTIPAGGAVYFPIGQYIVSGGTITNDRSANSALSRVSFRGEDQNGVQLIYSGVGNNCISISNAHTGSGESNTSYQTISNFTILGPAKRANSSGITVNLGAFMKMDNLNIQNFDYGLYLQDVDQAYFEKVTSRFNNKGIFASKAAVPAAASTQPNNHTYTSCTISSCSDYGGLWSGGSCITWLGGDVEYCGSNASGFGTKFLNCGYEGGKGANILGTYFEGNRGIADIFLEGSAVESTPLLGCVHYINADFKRLAGVTNTVNHILCGFGPDNTVGHQQLVTEACTFKAFGGYTPNAANKSIAFTGAVATPTNYFDVGSLFAVALEKPDFIQSINKKDALITRVANQTLSSGVTAVWAVDTVVSPKLWSPTLAGGNITIDETGTYNICGFINLSSAAPGQKFIIIFVGGVIAGYAETTGSNNVINVNTTVRIAAGQTINLQVNQATGINVDIVGGGTGNSGITITKLYG